MSELGVVTLQSFRVRYFKNDSFNSLRDRRTKYTFWIAIFKLWTIKYLVWVKNEVACAEKYSVNNNNNIYLTEIGLLPGGSGCIHVHIYEKGARNLKPGGMHEKHAFRYRN